MCVSGVAISISLQGLQFARDQLETESCFSFFLRFFFPKRIFEVLFWFCDFWDWVLFGSFFSFYFGFVGGHSWRFSLTTHGDDDDELLMNLLEVEVMAFCSGKSS